VGELLTNGTFHIVYTSLTPLGLGLLLLFAPFELECAALKVKIRGSILAAVEPTGAAPAGSKEWTKVRAVILGNGAGVPKYKFYDNESGTSSEARFESNFGTGFKVSALEVEEAVTATVLEAKMFVINNE
jgi:hypothetical protein